MVFSRRGEREAALAGAAGDMLSAFHALLGRLLAPPASPDPSSVPASGSPRAGSPCVRAPSGPAPLLRGRACGYGISGAFAGRPAGLCVDAGGEGRAGAALRAWDTAWVAYLEQFVAWKCADAASLEGELVRAAAEMESSMLAKLGPSLLPRPRSPADLQAVVEQVGRDPNYSKGAELHRPV